MLGGFTIQTDEQARQIAETVGREMPGRVFSVGEHVALPHCMNDAERKAFTKATKRECPRVELYRQNEPLAPIALASLQPHTRALAPMQLGAYLDFVDASAEERMTITSRIYHALSCSAASRAAAVWAGLVVKPKGKTHGN